MALSRVFQDEINASNAIQRERARVAAERNQNIASNINSGQRNVTASGAASDGARITSSSQSANNVSSAANSPFRAPSSPAPVYNTPGGGNPNAGSAIRTTSNDDDRDSGGGGGGGGSAPLEEGGSAVPRSFFDLEEIRAALDAITARFELERGQLTSRREALGRAMQLLMGRLDKERDRTLLDNKARNSGSGRIRSGLFLKDQARIADTFADQVARARGEQDAQLSPIQEALRTLNARREAEREVEARRIAREQLATQAEIARALELV